MTLPSRERPWRALAFVQDATAPQGRKRVLAGRTAAKTRAGLDRFIRDHEQQGHAVDVIELMPMFTTNDSGEQK